MTRRDLEKLARAIARWPNGHERLLVARIIGGACTNDYPRFKWSVWFAACNLPRKSEEAKRAEESIINPTGETCPT